MINNQKVGALICEFNPLHNGHKYILDKIKENCDYCVCVMSGNFVQRGDLAIIDKWKRTKAALTVGADLVIELPVQFSLAGAEKFSYAGCFILNAIKCVDEIYFGSECGDIEMLKKCAEAVVDGDVSELIKKELNKGISFAAAREEAVRLCFGDKYADILKEPNNILGIEYIKALNKLHSHIEPKTFQRFMAGHNENPNGTFASSTSIREMLRSGVSSSLFIPDSMRAGLDEEKFADIKRLEVAILCKLRTLNPNELADTPDISEGLENKIYEAAIRSTSLEELYENVKSKRYSHARIRRLVLSAFLGIDKERVRKLPYIRVLGMNKKGEAILKEKRSTLPYVLSYGDAKKKGLNEQFEFEAKCDSVYTLARKTPTKGNDYYSHTIIKT